MHELCFINGFQSGLLIQKFELCEFSKRKRKQKQFLKIKEANQNHIYSNNPINRSLFGRLSEFYFFKLAVRKLHLCFESKNTKTKFIKNY